jgi:hypothetical protein
VSLVRSKQLEVCVEMRVGRKIVLLRTRAVVPGFRRAPHSSPGSNDGVGSRIRSGMKWRRVLRSGGEGAGMSNAQWGVHSNG